MVGTILMEYLVENLTRFELKELIEKDYYAIIPVGACEQHGPHLPIGTDKFLAEFISKKIAEKIDSVVFPTLNFGYSWVWKELPGTMTLSQETFKNTLYELIVSVIEQGFKHVIIVNGHDSNNKAIRYVQRDIKDSFPNIQVLAMFYPGISELYKKYMESDMWHGMFHADEWETSLMLLAKNDLVKMNLAVCEYPKAPLLYGLDSSSLSTISKSGIYGDPTKASLEKGQKICDELIDNIVSLLKATKYENK